jgi:FMN-dependent NADH-azoreductase
VWDADLPDVDSVAVSARNKRLAGERQTAEEAERWTAMVAVIARFDAAGKVLLSCPLWTSTMPSPLRNYLDVLIQGFHGGTRSRERRPLQLILTRTTKSAAAGTDLRVIFESLGFTDVRSLLGGSDHRRSLMGAKAAGAAF